MGANVRIGCGVRLVNPQHIALGDNVTIGDACTLIARSVRGISLGEGATLKQGVYLDTERATGYIEIGRRVYIGTGCCLHGHDGLEIGDFFELLDFVDAIEGRRPNPIGIHEALDMTLPGLVSQQSITEGGRWIEVPDSRTW
jgi:carbonic anhydrase/acetyltransferase-like protein (isoleucine patch superfamily)